MTAENYGVLRRTLGVADLRFFAVAGRSNGVARPYYIRRRNGNFFGHVLYDVIVQINSRDFSVGDTTEFVLLGK